MARSRPLPEAGTGALARRNAGIDVVRGVSIVLVVIHHMALRIPLEETGLSAALPRRLLLALHWDGNNAVYLFFVVSGFLITAHAIRRWGSLPRIDLRAFYARRLARIAPCLIALLAVLSALHLARVPNYTITRSDQSLPGALLSALGLQLNWYEGRTGYLPGGWDVLWSLSIEEAFYLGFPLICVLTGRFPLVRAAGFAALALSSPISVGWLSTSSEIWQEKAYLPGMAAIAMGVCAASLGCAARPVGLKTMALLGWGSSILLGASLLFEPSFYRLLGDGYLLLVTGSVAVLLIAFDHGWGRPLEARWTSGLRSFGLMSYEIYLTHMFVVLSLVGLFNRSGSDLGAGWLWFIPALALSWGLGFLVDTLLSRPAGQWMRGRLMGADLKPRAA